VVTNSSLALGKLRCAGDVLLVNTSTGQPVPPSLINVNDMQQGLVFLTGQVAPLFTVQAPNTICLLPAGPIAITGDMASAVIATSAVSVTVRLDFRYVFGAYDPYATAGGGAVEPSLASLVRNGSAVVTIAVLAGGLNGTGVIPSGQPAATLTSPAFNSTSAVLPASPLYPTVTSNVALDPTGTSNSSVRWSSANALRLTTVARPVQISASGATAVMDAPAGLASQVRISLTLRHLPAFSWAANATLATAASAATQQALAAVLCLPAPAVAVLNVSALPGLDGAGFALTHLLLRVTLDRGTWVSDQGVATAGMPPTSDFTVAQQLRFPPGVTPGVAPGLDARAFSTFTSVMGRTSQKLGELLTRTLGLGCVLLSGGA